MGTIVVVQTSTQQGNMKSLLLLLTSALPHLSWGQGVKFGVSSSNKDVDQRFIFGLPSSTGNQFVDGALVGAAAEGGRDRLSSARMETRNSSFQPATNSAAMGGEGGTLKKIRTRSSSGDSLAVEEAATTTATTLTLAEERRDKRGKKMSTQSCLVCLETTTCQIVRIKEASTKEALTKEDSTRTKGASTKEDSTRTKGAST